MAIARTTIEAVRVTASDGTSTQFPWAQDTWYLIRDDQPFLDLLVRGHLLQPAPNDLDGDDDPTSGAKARPLSTLDDEAPEGATWQRWDLEADLARKRRLGELQLQLKVPKGATLRCYVIPARLLDLSDVLAMIGDIESELRIATAWDLATRRPERAWSRRGPGRASTPIELAHLVEEELVAARFVRRQPFSEIGLASRRNLPLPENALVSHWASRRHQELLIASELVARDVELTKRQAHRLKAPARLQHLSSEVKRLQDLSVRLSQLSAQVQVLISQSELTTMISPGPALQRDHRLRRLLRAFAPPLAESLSPVEATRSQYPPVLLNGLWELWGAVWLAMQIRNYGFVGEAYTRGADALRACSWRFQRDDVRIELDYEPDPVLLDHANLPPAHERVIPALEWAAKHQALDEERPFIGMELRCSPDYVIRITSPSERLLIVGDGSLASPDHHGGVDKQGTKPHTVEHYRRTLGWAVGDGVVRCHPLGAFVMFPPPSSAWAAFEGLAGVRDCTLLCPSPKGGDVASDRFANLLSAISPTLRMRAPLAS